MADLIEITGGYEKDPDVEKLDLSNPAHVKLALLSQGMRFHESALLPVGSKVKEKIRSYNSSDFTKIVTIPQELILGDDIVVGTHWRDESPWEIAAEDEGFALSYDGKRITGVGFHDRPEYYDREVVKGIPAKRIGVTLGMGAVSFFMRETCTYWEGAQPCKFCSLKATQNRYGETEQYKNSDMVRALLSTIQETGDHLHHIQFSGGSIWNHDDEFKEYIEAVKAASDTLGRRIDGNLITMPPRDLSLIDEAYAAGMNHISFNLEVWDPALFREVCPGKDASYGRDNMIAALEYAAGVFKNGTYTTFVGGLEPLESMFEGWDYLAARGVAPAFNVFHPTPGSIYQGKKAPGVGYLIEAAGKLQDVYQSHDFEGLLCKCCNRNALDNEAKEGYFK